MSNMYSKFCSYSIGKPVTLDKPVNYVLSGSGAKEIRVNEIGTFTTTPDKIAGLEPVKEGFFMKLPKIPLNILFEIIGFFKEVFRIYYTEVMVQIYWDREKKEYFVIVPKQGVTSTSVKFKRDKKKDEMFLLVADIHSHHTMGSFFSSIDNADEKESKIYGVIGEIEREIPDIKFRACSGGSAVDVPLTEIFDMDFTFPEEWLKQVKVKEEEIREYRCGLGQGNLLNERSNINKEYSSKNLDIESEQRLANVSRERIEKTFDQIMLDLMPEEISELTERLLYCTGEY